MLIPSKTKLIHQLFDNGFPTLPPPSDTYMQLSAHISNIAARLISKLTGKSLPVFIQNELFDPLQLRAGFEEQDMDERAVGSWEASTEADVPHETSVAEGVDHASTIDFGSEDCAGTWGGVHIWMSSNDLVSIRNTYIHPYLAICYPS